MRRHSQIHVRVENYNPRQRRLRNLIIEDGEGGQSEADSSQPTEEASLEDTAAGAASASASALPESCADVQVMIQPSALELEEVVSSQSVTLGDVAQGFTVPAELE